MSDPNGQINIEERLASFLPFWSHLTGEEQARLVAGTQLRHFKRNSVVYDGSGDCLGVLCILSGQLRTYMLSENGREITLYRLYGGDVCVLAASCVLESITFDVAIDAQEDTQLLLIQTSVFRALSEQNIYVKCFGYEQSTERFSDVMWAMQQILFMDADRRLAIFLWDETRKTGSDELHMTQNRIAQNMGSAREVVTRLLKYFVSEGVVELFRGGIRVVDREKLGRLAGADK